MLNAITTNIITATMPPPLDASDALGRMAHLLRYRERCGYAIKRHDATGNQTAQAQWLKLLRASEREIEELLPEVFLLLNEIENEMEK